MPCTRPARRSRKASSPAVVRRCCAPHPRWMRSELEGDQRTGADILKRALQEPLRQLVANAGLEGSVVVEHLSREKRANWGFDVMSESYVDLVKAGIIDPAKVTRSALENAASVAGMILSTEALVTELAEGQAVVAGAGARGMHD